ncbi:MAG: enoyl-CoA hydratase/isomerase family protein [Candidatus Nanopelagicales bacterium]
MEILTDLAGDQFNITLNEPEKRNAQTPQTWDDLYEICQAVPEEARFIVLRGNGKSFSAGMDRAMFTPGGIPGQPSFMDMAAQTDTQLDDTIAHYQRFFRVLRDLPQISIALVQGHAIGAGFQIALACDFIIAEPQTVFALKEAQWGLTPDLGGTVRFMEKLGYHKSLELIGSGRNILAEEALALGLITGIHSDLGVGLQEFTDPLRAVMPEVLVGAKALTAGIAFGEEPWVAERRAQAKRVRHLHALMSQQ